MRKLANEILNRRSRYSKMETSEVGRVLQKVSDSTWKALQSHDWKSRGLERQPGHLSNGCSSWLRVSTLLLLAQDITQIVKVMDAFNKNREIVSTLREAGDIKHHQIMMRTCLFKVCLPKLLAVGSGLKQVQHCHVTLWGWAYKPNC